MTLDQVKDFARTPTKNLPEHKADGKMATNTMFQQKESTGKKRPDWMERAVPHMADGKKSGQLPMKPGAPTGAYRVKKTVVDAAPAPREKYFKTAW